MDAKRGAVAALSQEGRRGAAQFIALLCIITDKDHAARRGWQVKIKFLICLDPVVKHVSPLTCEQITFG